MSLQLLTSINVVLLLTGWPARAPYNAIHVGAASPPSVIDALEAQLAKPGRLFIPVEDPASGAQ